MIEAKCNNHYDRMAEFECADCHRRFCQLCIEKVAGKTYCEYCYTKLVRRGAKSEYRKGLYNDLTLAGLIIIAFGIPFALTLSVISFSGGHMTMGHGILMGITILAGIFGLLLFMIGMIFSRTCSLRRPIVAIIIGIFYITSLINPILSSIANNGFLSLIKWEPLLVLAPGLLLIVMGLISWILRYLLNPSCTNIMMLPPTYLANKD